MKKLLLLAVVVSLTDYLTARFNPHGAPTHNTLQSVSFPCAGHIFSTPPRHPHHTHTSTNMNDSNCIVAMTITVIMLRVMLLCFSFEHL